MKIIIIRHAISVDRKSFALSHDDDRLRPLSKKGSARFERARRGLKRVQPEVDYLLTSTLTRAVQTGDLLTGAYPNAVCKAITQLDPGGDPAELTNLLADLPEAATVLLVGHQPDLSALISWYTHGDRLNFLQLKRGAACLLQFKGAPRPAAGQLIWLLPPRQLRRLGQ